MSFTTTLNWVAATTAFVAVTALAPLTTNPTPPDAPANDSHYVACMEAAAPTPDALEHSVPTCRSIATRTTSCLSGAAATADAREQWIDACRARARAELGRSSA